MKLPVVLALLAIVAVAIFFTRRSSQGTVYQQYTALRAAVARSNLPPEAQSELLTDIVADEERHSA